MRVQCGAPGIATIAMWAAQAPKNLARSTKPLMRRKVAWKGTTLQIIRCEGTHFAFRVFSFTSGKTVCRRDVREREREGQALKAERECLGRPITPSKEKRS